MRCEREKKKKSIYVRVTGGLGNQLFQVLKAYKVQREENGKILYVDRYQNDFFRTKSYAESDFREFSLERIGLVDNDVSFHCRSPNFLCRLIFKFRLAKIFSKTGTLNLFDNIYIDGYFIENEEFGDEVRVVSEQIFKKNSCPNTVEAAVHVRAGDLLRQPQNLLVTKQYYHSSMKQIEKKFGVTRFLIVTEDVEFAERFFSSLDSNYVVNFQALSETEDFLSLMCCDYLIAANSTFSWVAGLLGRSQYMSTTEYFYTPGDKPTLLPHEVTVCFDGSFVN